MLPSEELLTPKIESIMEESHEGRLQKLESDISDLKVNQAETTAALTYLGNQLTESTNRLADKIDSCVAPLASTLHEHIQEDSKTTEKVNKLDEERQTRDARWALVKKALFTILTGGCAIFAKEIAVVIIKHL